MDGKASSGERPLYASVALPLPVRRLFDYRIGEPLDPAPVPGQRVRVPFGPRRLVGFVVDLPETPEIPAPKLKPIAEVIDPTPLVNPELLRLTRWMADYYLCSWGEALAATLPSGVRNRSQRRRISNVRLLGDRSPQERIEELQESRPAQARVLRVLSTSGEAMTMAELARRAGTTTSPIRTLARRGEVAIETISVEDDPFANLPPSSDEKPTLTAEQEKALLAIHAAVERRSFHVELVWGVTGSGKTEIYLRAIAEVVARNQQAIVLVPEIALTPQTVRRFRARFERVAVLHSGLTDAQRALQWQRIASGQADVVIGPRSAVFAPVADLGLIVLDEEHEPSFKQNSTPRYHARDLAVMRAHLAGATVVLGSATPSLESFANSMRGKYSLSILPKRANRQPLPAVRVIDMSRESRTDKGTPLLSHELVIAMRQALLEGDQIILFRNRRGHSTFLGCLRCGHVVSCPRCDLTLTYHASFRRALCHYCHHEESPGTSCPECLQGRLVYRGAGTERIEAVVEKLFPEIRMARMDSDTMVTRGAYERVLGDFEDRRLDLLIGTQMIGKGLDFPSVTVVGVLSADSILHFPDFRSAERTFQLITQVAGRAGRGQKGGRVYVQTLQPDHYAVQAASRHDFKAFAERDLVHRRELGYPPFGRLARVVCHGPDAGRVEERIHTICRQLTQAVDDRTGQILGPAPCPISRIDDRHRWHALVKATSPSVLASILSAVEIPTSGGIQFSLDVDPIDMV